MEVRPIGNSPKRKNALLNFFIASKLFFIIQSFYNFLDVINGYIRKENAGFEPRKSGSRSVLSAHAASRCHSKFKQGELKKQ